MLGSASLPAKTGSPINLVGVLAGAIGGLLGFALGEPFAGQSVVLWSGLVGLALGVVLAAAENQLGLRGRLTRGLPRAAVNGFLVGAIGGTVGQYVYASGASSLTRGLGWSCLGAGVGLVLGFADKSLAKSLRGAVGGAVGGFAGGLLFDLVFALFSRGGDTGTIPRAVGLCLLGAATGFAIGLVQQLLKSAWLMGLTSGPYEGKEYILAKPLVTVGRSDANDVALYRESILPLKAGALRAERGGWVWEGEPVAVNGVAGARHQLQAGDVISFGGTDFLFQLRGSDPAPRPPVTPPEVAGAASFALVGPDGWHDLPGGTLTIGRAEGNGLVLPDQTVSGRHALLTSENGRLTITDGGSTNGTFLNGSRLTANAPAEACVGDRLSFGTREYLVARGKA